MFFTRNPAQVYQNLFPVKPDLVCASKGNSFSGHFAQASAKIAAIPQQFETPKSDSPALLLLGAFLQPLYMNDEAVSILFYPQTPRGDGHGAYFLKQRIDPPLPRRNGSSDPKFSGELASGRRRYQVRVFAMKSNLQGHAAPTLAVLLERNREHPDLLRAARRFRLTQRETAALELRCDTQPSGAKRRNPRYSTGGECKGSESPPFQARKNWRSAVDE